MEIINKYNAIIIEPRKHKALEFVLNNVCECLENNWNIILFHSDNNEKYVTIIVEKLNNLYDNRISLVNLHTNDYSLTEYSKLFCTKSIIYDYITSDTFLVFQTDSMIFKNNKNLITFFLNYDYVGAPWLMTNYIPTKNCDFIGNGGFSLRNKNKMLEIIEKIPWNNNYEDLYFSTNYESIKVNKPDYSNAISFCVDEVFNEHSFACHKPWSHSHYDYFKTIYPEVEILRNLQDIEN